MQSKQQDRAVIDFSVKGSIVRGLVTVLKQDGKLAPIEAKLAGETLAMVRSLPTPGAWIDGARVVELEAAMSSVLDARTLRDVARRSVSVELRAITRTMTEGILRLFGATPATLFSRVAMFDPITVKNVKNSWTEIDEHSGQVRTLFASSKNLPDVMGEISAGMLAATLELCAATGTVVYKGMGGDQRNELVFDVKWD